MTVRTLYEFGPFSLDPVKRLLMRQGHIVDIPPRALDVLRALIERRGAPVDKDALLHSVWHDAVVEENNLTVSISALRKALGETIRDHRYIVTLPRRGYAFVASVTERVSDETPPATAAHGPVSQTQLLVLPFDLIVGSAHARAARHLPQAVLDGIAARLGNSQQVGIMTRPLSASTQTARDPVVIGRRSSSDYVLAGSLRLDVSRVRVMARLLRTSDSVVVCGEAFDDSLDDLFSAEGRIAERLAHWVVAYFEEDLVRRSARRTTESADAHRDYVRGRYFWNKRTEEGLRKAIEHFERAIHTDPAYALPYAGLADCFNLLSTYGAISPRQGVPRAVRAARRALEIDETLPEAHTSLAYARFAYYWNWEEAERYFRRAIHLNPAYATGHHLFADHLTAQGRFDEAIASIQRAAALEPLSLIINTDLGWVLFHARRWAQGVDQLKKTLEMDANFAPARWVLGLTLLHSGRADAAVGELETARGLSANSPHILASLAQALGAAKRTANAEQCQRELHDLGRRQYVSSYHHAVAHIGVGEFDQAIKALGDAVAERAHWVTYFKVTPTLDALRGHAAFEQLLQHQ